MDLKNSAVFAAYNNAANITQGNVNPAGKSGVDFGEMVVDAIGDTSNQLHKAEEIGKSALVDGASLEELAGAVNNAEITLKTVVAVRDKIISAYQDIIKMPI
jgi:flagellar hook-basal body complex protein FliE